MVPLEKQGTNLTITAPPLPVTAQAHLGALVALVVLVVVLTPAALLVLTQQVTVLVVGAVAITQAVDQGLMVIFGYRGKQ